MGTTCKFKSGILTFSGNAMMVSAGTITANAQVANSTTETVLVTETVYGNTFDTAGMGFRVTVAGEISSDGSDDCTFTLRYGTTDICAVTTVSLANEDDKIFKLVYEGRIHTTGATGKVVAIGTLDVFQGTALFFQGKSAATGATVNLTADGSLNVTAQWDGAAADSDVLVTVPRIEFFA
jgi:hypothetical protein